MALQVGKLERIYAVRAYRRNTNYVVFQKPPATTDGRGFPTQGFEDLDPDHPIPCIYSFTSGSKTVVIGKGTAVTLYAFEIPSFYKTTGDQLVPVDFSKAYRVRLLGAADKPERFFHVVDGGNDPGPVIIFTARELENTV